MMKGTIENREAFLKKIAGKLHRAPEKEIDAPAWENEPQWDVFKDYSQDRLVAVMKKASESIHTNVYETVEQDLPHVLDEVIDAYGGAPVVTTRDDRFTKYGLTDVLSKYEAYTWTPSKGHENIEKAQQANTGISFCDVMLAESATVGLFNDKDKARSVSLLPLASIVIVPKSVIVPRITQAMARIEEKVAAGEDVSNYINFISGPSNSADIEMRLVVGVHGPVKVTYIVVDDK